MAERRTLTDGIKATTGVDPAIAEEFVYGHARPGTTGSNAAPTASSAPTGTTQLNRVPISTRIREDFARAFKRASLERQLNGVEPNTLQAFLEEAIEPWLRQNKLWP